jgi:hypothetical protein
MAKSQRPVVMDKLSSSVNKRAPHVEGSQTVVLESTNGENQQRVTNEPVEFEKTTS